MDREQFVEAVRKGLRDLHLSLVNNAKSQPEELIARLLESRSDREKICEGIAEIIVSERFQYGMAMREANEKNHLSDTLRQSEPFQTLLNDLRMQILPQSLKDIVQTASYGSLSLSEQNNNSLVNQTKAFIEDFTMLKWNWWPLEPRMRDMSSNETRLLWRCVS